MLASFSCGRSTALILDSGYKSTYATPVHDGYALQKCILKMDIAGEQITNELRDHLKKQNVQILPRFAFKKKLMN